MTDRASSHALELPPGARLAAGIVASLTLLAVGWAGLLIPSLLRSIKETFDQTDAGIGLVYLVYAIAYALGSFVGGPTTERAGRRLTLGAGGGGAPGRGGGGGRGRAGGRSGGARPRRGRDGGGPPARGP